MLDTRVCCACVNRSAITEFGTLLKRHTLVPSPTIPIHFVAWLEKGRGNSQKCNSQAITVRWNPRYVVTALKIAPTQTKGDNPILWKWNAINANVRCFTVVSAITECWHTKFQHVTYVWFVESLQKHGKIHCQSPSWGLGSQQWSH